MSALARLLSLLHCLAALSAGAAVSTNAVAVTPPPLQIVTCREDVDVDALLNEFQLRPKFIYRGLNGFAAPMDAATIQALKSDGRVLYVEADGPVSLCDQTNSTGLVRMGIDQFPVAHINQTNEPLNVDVAVIDTGIDPHPELNIYQTVSTIGGDGSDTVGHGTAVAGIIGAMDNGLGVVGVAPGVRIWSVKVMDANNNGWSVVLSGMDYVRQNSNQISVANMSFVNTGANAPVLSLRLLVQKMVSAGIVVVAAAGNDSRDLAGLDGIYGTGDDAYPAALSDAVAVSAMDPVTDRLLPSSNFSQIPRTNIPSGSSVANYVFSPGGAMDVAAPGYNILTTSTNSGYALFSGTSFAAPHVTGLVALYIAANGRATNAEGVYRIRQAIIDSSLPQSQWHTNNTLDPDTNPEPLAIASEHWVPQPFITSADGTPGNFSVQFATVPGYDYTVQSATNLTPPIPWENLRTVSGGSNVALVNVTDTNAASQSFYRLNRAASP